MTKLIITLSMIILVCLITPVVYGHYKKPVIIPVQVIVVKSPEVNKVQPVKKVVTESKVLEATPEERVHIQKIFGDKTEVAIATFKHESGLILDQKGWNCYYYNSKGVKYSTSCKTISDRQNAWSVDCGIAQINTKGKVCPPELLTLEGNMEAAEKIYKAQGLTAWYSYTSGAYKKFMPNS